MHATPVYEADVANQVRLMDPLTLQYPLDSPNSEDSSNLIVAIEPFPNSCYRDIKKITSQRVFEVLWNKRPDSERIDLYLMFRRSEFAVGTTGWFFESQIHHLFRRGRTIWVYHILGKLVTASVQYDDYSASGKIQGAFPSYPATSPQSILYPPSQSWLITHAPRSTLHATRTRAT